MQYTVNLVTGEVIEFEDTPLDPIITTPSEVTALQGLLVIDAFGLSENYSAWAESTERTFAQKAFINKAMTWRRDDITLAAAAAALGLSQEQLDLMFQTAATL